MTVIAFAPQIDAAARKYGLDARLLAAVAAQETGGPGSTSGRNVVGDGGHGRGLFQIDDRWHPFARTAAAMNPQANADYAAGMLASLLKRYGDVRKALSAYNAGDPNAGGTQTTWQDGKRLGYADSVLRHYATLGGANSRQGASMGFSIGNIIKGVVGGAEALAETANPAIAIGAAAIGGLLGGGSNSAALPTFDPLLDEMSANLNAGSQPRTYSYMQLAGLDANGNSTNGQRPDLGSIVDGDDSSGS